MPLALSIHGTHPLPDSDVERLVVLSIELAAPELELGVPVDVGVHFVDAARIRDLNREHRAVDSATDVLSFPIDARDTLSRDMPRQLGDIFVCVAYVREQVATGEQISESDTDVAAALRRCVVHGCLHLLAYDHEGDDPRGDMLQLEQRILDAWAEGSAHA